MLHTSFSRKILARARSRSKEPEGLAERRRCAERNFVQAYSTRHTDVWYIIDAAWHVDWERFVVAGGPPPGPIRNDRLFEPATGKPIAGLRAELDYRGVNAAVWTHLHERHGGGPVICRECLDLYAPAAKVESQSTSFLGDHGCDSDSEDSADEDTSRRAEKTSTAASSTRASSSSPAPTPPGTPRRAAAAHSNRGRPLATGRSRLGAAVKAFNFPFKRGNPHTALSCSSNSPPLSPRTQAPGPRAQAAAMEGEDGALMLRSPTSESHEADPHFLSSLVARVVAQPDDGSCLFHALCQGLQDGTSAGALRLELGHYLVANPSLKIAGTTLQDWVKFDSGCSLAGYAAHIAGMQEDCDDGRKAWGGGIELEAFAHKRQVDVFVYEESDGGYRRISTFTAGRPEGEAAKIVRILFRSKNHYDALTMAE